MMIQIIELLVTYLGEPEGTLGPWLQPGSGPAFGTIWAMNQQMEPLILCLSVTPPFKQINTSFLKKKLS